MNRHVGDLGNITTDANGVAVIDFTDNIISLFDPTTSIAGRTIIVHVFPDDGGTGNGTSNTTGYDIKPF